MFDPLHLLLVLMLLPPGPTLAALLALILATRWVMKRAGV